MKTNLNLHKHASITPRRVAGSESSTAPKISITPRGHIVATLLLVFPFLLGAADEERTTVEQNRRKIQEMTAREQQKLKRNFAEFQKLSPEEQEAYRKLHRQLEADDKKGGKLREVMWVYDEWLKTLSPWQREELLKEKDPAARLNMVKEFKAQQEYEEWEKTLRYSERSRLRRATGKEKEKVIEEIKREQETRPPRSDSGYGGFRYRFPHVTPEQLDEIVDVVQQYSKLSPAVSDQLHDATKVERHLLVLLESLKQNSKDNPPASGKQRIGKGSTTATVRWPDDELMGKIMEAISDEDYLKRLQSYGNDTERRRRSIFFRVINGFNYEWTAELRRDKPSEEELQAFFKELDPSEKDDLLRRSPSDTSRKLMYLYYSKRGSQSRYQDEYSEFREITKPFYYSSRERGRSNFSRGGSQGRKPGPLPRGNRPPEREKKEQGKPPGA